MATGVACGAAPGITRGGRQSAGRACRSAVATRMRQGERGARARARTLLEGRRSAPGRHPRSHRNPTRTTMRGFSIASVALMVAACSGDDDPAPAPSTPTGATDAGTEAAPPADDAGGDTGAPEPDAGAEGGDGGGPTATPAEAGDTA